MNGKDERGEWWKSQRIKDALDSLAWFCKMAARQKTRFVELCSVLCRIPPSDTLVRLFLCFIAEGGALTVSDTNLIMPNYRPHSVPYYATSVCCACLPLEFCGCH